MTTLRLIKSMTRSLTIKEQKAIVKYWETNKKLNANQVIKYWEQKLKMPVTHHALVKAMITYGE